MLESTIVQASQAFRSGCRHPQWPGSLTSLKYVSRRDLPPAHKRTTPSVAGPFLPVPVPRKPPTRSGPPREDHWALPHPLNRATVKVIPGKLPAHEGAVPKCGAVSSKHLPCVAPVRWWRSVSPPQDIVHMTGGRAFLPLINGGRTRMSGLLCWTTARHEPNSGLLAQTLSPG